MDVVSRAASRHTPVVGVARGLPTPGRTLVSFLPCSVGGGDVVSQAGLSPHPCSGCGERLAPRVEETGNGL